MHFFADMEVPTRSESRGFNTNTPFVPSSPMEIFLAAVLCLISVIVVAYTMVVLYRCICTRNYAEWRASWHQQEKSQDSSTQLVLETLPLVLEGHTQEVECIATDGSTIASTCLAGHIRVWDSITGEVVAHIDRKKFFTSIQSDLINGTPDPDELMSDYESGSPPSRGEIDGLNSFGIPRRKFSPSGGFQNNSQGTDKRHSMNCLDYDHQINEFTGDKRMPFRRSLDQCYDLPDLRSSINTRFSGMAFSPVQTNYKQGFDYGQHYRHLFEKHRQGIEDVKNSESIDGFSPNLRFNRGEITGSAGSLDGGKTARNGLNVSAIWCVDYQENIIVVGCANGCLEFWEGTTGRFKVSFFLF